MNEHKILINRTLNCVNSIKHCLPNAEDNGLYNDMIILAHIIPTLPK
jgi:hypothetical protein